MSFDGTRHTESSAFQNIQFQELFIKLDRQIGTYYPLITHANMADFQDGTLPHGSLTLFTPESDEILQLMFARAAKPDGGLISSHGLKHQKEAFLACSALANAAEKRKLTITPVDYVLENKHHITRYELSASAFFRREWPESIIEAGWLLNKSEDDKIWGLRQIADECGYDVAMLTGVYLRLDKNAIFDGVFGTKNLPDTDGGGIALPRIKRHKDMRLFNELIKAIIYENNPDNLQLNTNEKAYNIALKLLLDWGAHPNNFMRFLVRIRGKAIAVVPSLMEMAYQYSPEQLSKNHLLRLVELFKARIQTNIITSYVAWDFKTMSLVSQGPASPLKDVDNLSTIVATDAEEATSE